MPSHPDRVRRNYETSWEGPFSIGETITLPSRNIRHDAKLASPRSWVPNAACSHYLEPMSASAPQPMPSDLVTPGAHVHSYDAYDPKIDGWHCRCGVSVSRHEGFHGHVAHHPV